MSGNIVHTSDASFAEDVLKANVPVLLDFWAEWCGPCKAIAPVLDEIAKDYDGRVKIAKIDIDRNPQTPQKYGIRGIPTLILFKNGAPQAQQVDVVPGQNGALQLRNNSFLVAVNARKHFLLRFQAGKHFDAYRECC